MIFSFLVSHRSLLSTCTLETCVCLVIFKQTTEPCNVLTKGSLETKRLEHIKSRQDRTRREEKKNKEKKRKKDKEREKERKKNEEKKNKEGKRKKKKENEKKQKKRKKMKKKKKKRKIKKNKERETEKERKKKTTRKSQKKKIHRAKRFTFFQWFVGREGRTRRCGTCWNQNAKKHQVRTTLEVGISNAMQIYQNEQIAKKSGQLVSLSVNKILHCQLSVSQWIT